MTALYAFLGLVVVYCLYQSVRFRMRTWGERKKGVSMAAIAIANLSGDPHDREEVRLTPEGVRSYRTHLRYDFIGVLAAIALLLLWGTQTGALDAFMSWTETLPEAQP